MNSTCHVGTHDSNQRTHSIAQHLRSQRLAFVRNQGIKGPVLSSIVAVLRPHSSYFLSPRTTKNALLFVLPPSLWLVILSPFLHHAPLLVRIAVLPNRSPIVSDRPPSSSFVNALADRNQRSKRTFCSVHVTAVVGGGPGPIPPRRATNFSPSSTSFLLWRFRGTSSWIKRPVWRASLAVISAVTQCNIAAQEVFHLAALTLLIDQCVTDPSSRRWRALLRIYIPLLTESNIWRRPTHSRFLWLPAFFTVGYGFTLISGFGNLSYDGNI